MRRIVPLAALFLGFVGPTMVLAAPSEQHGKVVFQKWCEPCHARAPSIYGPMMMPGTEALRVKYKGRIPPVLEDRTDLTAALIAFVVRHGQNGMPISRKTEISDADLDDIGAYLTRKTR
jgi:mono/diheme cytochrome c family protein